MQYILCRHIKTNGLQCQSPTLHTEPWCYFHSRLHQRHTPFRHSDATRGYLIPGQHIQLTALEDRESVQVALSVVINALATGQLETRRATALLYGLQLASNNATRLNTKPYPPEVIRSVDSSPEGLDLAHPGNTIEVPDQHNPNDDFDHDDEEDEDNEEQEDRISHLFHRLNSKPNPQPNPLPNPDPVTHLPSHDITQPSTPSRDNASPSPLVTQDKPSAV